jgi:hypothetical protein
MTVKVVEVLFADIPIELFYVIFCDGSFWMTGELCGRVGEISTAREHQSAARLFLKPEMYYMLSEGT